MASAGQDRARDRDADLQKHGMKQMAGAAKPFPAHRPLFAIAAVHAAAVVPLWAAAYGGFAPWQPPAFWHGHEMLFGFALALIGGYLVTRASGREVGVAIALWVAGRGAAALPELPAVVGAVAALSYPVCLFVLAGLPLLRAAKRWRNLVFAPILAAFVLAELVFQGGAAGLIAEGEQRGLAVALTVVALLLFVMGGRVIAAAGSGAMQRAGAPHRDMAQAPLEAAGVVSLAGAALCSLFGAPTLAAGAAAIAGALAALRLVGWRFWLLLRHGEIALLGLGYGWLAVGLPLFALPSVADGGVAWGDAVHGVGVGALGTLAATMMMRVARQRARLPIVMSGPGLLAVALVNLAALARLAVIGCEEGRLTLVVLSAALWGAGFLIVCAEVLRTRPGTAQRRRG